MRASRKAYSESMDAQSVKLLARLLILGETWRCCWVGMLFKQTRGFIMSEEKPTTSAPCAYDDHDPSECPSGNLQDTISSRDANDHDSAASATTSSSEGTPSDWEVVTSSEEGSPVIPKIEPSNPFSNETNLPTLTNDAQVVVATAHISTHVTTLDTQKPPTAEGDAHTSTNPSYAHSADACKPSAEDVVHPAATRSEEEGSSGIVRGSTSTESDSLSTTAATSDLSVTNTSQAVAPEDSSNPPVANEEESSTVDDASSNSQSDVPASEVVPPASVPDHAEMTHVALHDSGAREEDVQVIDATVIDAELEVPAAEDGFAAQAEGTGISTTTEVAPAPDVTPQVAPSDSTPTPQVSVGDNKPIPEASNDTSNTATGGAVAPGIKDVAPADTSESAPSDSTSSAQPSVVGDDSDSTPVTTMAVENVVADGAVDATNVSTPQLSEDNIKPVGDTPSVSSNSATGEAVASIANIASQAGPVESKPSDTTSSAEQSSVVDTSSDSTPISGSTEAVNMVAGGAGDAPSTDPVSDATQAPQSPGGDASAPDAVPGAEPTAAATVDSTAAVSSVDVDTKAAEGDSSSDIPRAESSGETPAAATEIEGAAAETPPEPSSPPPPPPILPSGISKRMLRPYTSDETQTNNPAASGVIIPESILEEISATVAYSLSPTAQEKAWKATKDRLEHVDDLERIHEPMVHLCYPYAHCHDVVDEAVRDIAKRQKADLVTIDVLDLAQMEFGPLGEKIAEAVKQLYSGKYYKDGVDESVQNVFDALVQVQPEEAATDSSSSGTQRRIIYIKDFGTTILFSNRLLCRVLRAIHKRRCNATAAGTLLLPTVLVLGYVKSFNIDSDTLEAFSEGGNNLRMLLDRPADKLCSVPWGYKPFPGPLPNFCTAYFLKSVLPKKDQNNLSSSSISNREDLEIDHYQLYAGAYLSVFPQGDVDKEKNREAESRMVERRQCDVFDAWMSVCLAHRGAEGPGYSVRYLGSAGASEDGESEGDVDYALVAKNVDGLAKKLGCVNLSAIDRVVITAIGLASTPQEEVVPGKELQEDAAVQETPTALDVTPIPGQEDAPVKEVQEDKPDVTPTPDEVVAPEREVQDDAAAQEEVEATPTPDEEGTPAEEVAQKVTPVKVAASHILKAYALVLGGLDVREKWYKEKHPEVEKSEDKDSEDEEEPEEKAVDVVAQVKAASDLTEHEKQLLGSIVDTGRLASSFDDISVPECVIETLRTIITLPLLFPEAFSTGLLQREAMSGVLLYGPPGTGKTLLCRIAARECGARMLLIKPSDIMNKWVGESEKLVNAIFSLANRLAPCIVFIDEVDSCFRARSGDDKKWIRDMMSEFLQAMDGLVSSRKEEGGVLVIGATNRPYDIDDAIIRRLPSRMLIGSPGVTEREAILKIHLQGEALDNETDLPDIARMTVDYSGSDLKNLCVSAVMASLKEAVGKIDWSQVSSLSKKQTKMSEPANEQAEEPKAEEPESGVDAAKEKVKTRTVKMAHFRQAMKEVAPSSSAGSHRELYRWHERFGSMSR